MQVWPAIDLRQGRCVRLAQGDYARQTIYGEDPVAWAREWLAAGAERLHLVDLDGAKGDPAVNRPTIVEIVRALPIPCQVGGGIRTAEAIEGLLGCGVQQVVCGTRACQDLEWLEQMTTRFPQRICVGIDARDGRVATQGWTESSDQDAWELARRVAQFPIAGIVFTDIARDGVLQGPNSLAMETMAHAVTVPVIASGGISSLDDIADLARRGLHGCIVGRALYEGRLTIADANAVAQKNSAIAN